MALATCADSVPTPPSQGLALWSEFETEEQVAALLPTMKKWGLVLNRSVVMGETNLDELEVLVRRAGKEGVEVRLWPELSEADGRWPSISTRRLFIPFVHALMDFVRDRNLPIKVFYVDLEPPLTRGRELLDALQKPGANTLQELLRFYEAKVYDPDFESGREEFKLLVDTAHSRGFQIYMTTIPFILDDFGDGDASIQRALESPVEGINWDEISFQVYTTMFSALYGLDLGPDLVYDYARTAREKFGEKAALDLGLFLEGPDTFSGAPGYSSPGQFHADILAAIAAGLNTDRLHIFSLEGLLAKTELGSWFDWDPASAVPPRAEPSVTLLRGLLRSVDEKYQ